MRKIRLNSKKVIVFLLIFSMFYLSSCEAMRRKFTRKPKKQEKEIEDVVFIPQEYPETPYSKEEIYKNQYLFWKSWHSELINYLYEGASRKKQIDCISEALASLDNMKNLLSNAEKQKELDVYIQELEKIRQKFLSPNPISLSSVRNRLNSLQNKIQKSFSYNKVKDYTE